ncbi:glycine-rich domain-containing protein [Pseudomonas sp. GNP014]
MLTHYNSIALTTGLLFIGAVVPALAATQTFTSTSEFPIPEGVTEITYTLIGGGGGGGGGGGAFDMILKGRAAGGGGGGAASSVKCTIPVSSGKTLQMDIGRGGNGGPGGSLKTDGLPGEEGESTIAYLLGEYKKVGLPRANGGKGGGGGSGKTSPTSTTTGGKGGVGGSPYAEKCTIEWGSAGQNGSLNGGSESAGNGAVINNCGGKGGAGGKGGEINSSSQKGNSGLPGAKGSDGCVIVEY